MTLYAYLSTYRHIQQRRKANESYVAGLERLPKRTEGRAARLTKDDWDAFTYGRRYLDSRGQLGREGFVICTRLALNSYAHRAIASSMQEISKQGETLSLLLYAVFMIISLLLSMRPHP